MRARAAVFMFHDLVAAERLADVPAPHRPYALTPEEFRAFLMVARQSPRHAVPAGGVPGDLAGLFYALTFDDGHASNYTDAFPVLRENGMRATFFIVPTLIGQPGYVSWDQLREMVSAGMEVGSHSLTHPFVDELGRDDLEHEFGESKRMIEDRLGVAVRSASLPRGWAAPGLTDVLRGLGYRVFCTSRVGWWHPGDQPLAMPRIPAWRDLGIDRFAAILNGERGALSRMQVTEAGKNVVKSFLGRRGWNRLRAPLLKLRYSERES
jgi:peptidoglycan/xylan/chitin deacetylase (PgdA/CDA1 family)